MIYFIIIIVINISQALLELNGSTTLCPCQQYSIHTCDLISSCSWYQQNCEDLICRNRNSTYCYGPYSDYKCIWDDTQNYCKDFKKKECEEITNSKDCLMSQNNDMDCTWTINGECKTLDCTRDFDCPLQKCSFINSTCSDPTNELNCSSINIDECNQTRNGKGIFCFLNDDGQCQSYNLATRNCSQWSDNQQGCNVQECSYLNRQCKDKTCSHIQNQEECNFVYQNDFLNKTLCFWLDNQCQTLEENNIFQVSKENCQKYSTYVWSDDSCQRCNQIQQPQDLDTKWIIIIVFLVIIIIVIIIIVVKKVKEYLKNNTQVYPIGPLNLSNQRQQLPQNHQEFNNNQQGQQQNQSPPQNNNQNQRQQLPSNHQEFNNNQQEQQQYQFLPQNNIQNQIYQLHPYYQQINNNQQEQQQNQSPPQNNNQNQRQQLPSNHQEFNNNQQEQQQNQFLPQNNIQNQIYQLHPYYQQINHNQQEQQQNQFLPQNDPSHQQNINLYQEQSEDQEGVNRNELFLISQIQVQNFEQQPF